VDAVNPIRQSLTETLLVNGRTAWPRRAELGALVQGTVREVVVADGMTVEEGALLVRLADGEASARVREAEAAVAEARARLSRLGAVGLPAARQQVDRLRVEAAAATRDLERRSSLRDAGALAESEYDAARDRRDQTASQLVTAELELAANSRGGADTASARAALARAQAALEAAQAALANTRIRAPTAGQVLERRVEPGQIVRPGDSLVVFSGNGAMQVQVTPDEVHLGRLAVGQEAVVRVEAFPSQVLSTHVIEIAPQVDPGRGTVRVRLSLDEVAPAWLRPDMTATVEIVLGERADALLLPVTHVQNLGGAAPWVLVLDAGRATRRSVVLGAQDNRAVEVLEGLTESETVLPSGAVEPGERVRIGALRPALSPEEG